MQQFDRVVATFRPKRTDDLQPGGSKWIGWRGVWEALWIIEEGPYEGQWAMGPKFTGDLTAIPPFAWTPLEDLERIEEIEDVRGLQR